MPWSKFHKAVEVGEASLFQSGSHGASELLSESEGAQLWCLPDQPMGNTAWNPKTLLEAYDNSHELRFQEALGDSELVVHVKTRLHNFQSLEQHLYSLQANHDIKKVLLVTGDGAQVGDLTTRHALEFLSKNCPDLFSRMDFAVTWDGKLSSSETVNEINRQEMWLEEKLEFGATAVFTQPCWFSHKSEDLENLSDTELWFCALGIPRDTVLLDQLKKMPVFPGLMRVSTAQQWPRFWEAQLRHFPQLKSGETSLQARFHKRLAGVFGRYWAPQQDIDYVSGESE